MASLMKVRWWPFFSLFITFLILMKGVDGSRNGQLASYFRGDFQDESGNQLGQMVVSDASGTEFVYVGGTSIIYLLNTDLNQVLSEAPCVGPECDIKILEVASSPVNKLIYCEGLDGKCEYRNLTNLSKIGSKSTHVLVTRGMSVGVVMTSDMIMHIAQSQLNSGIPIIQAHLQSDDISYERAVSSTNSEVEYIQGVSWMEYSYFIVHSDGENSRLGRICAQNDQSSLNAYSEIILSCQHAQGYDSLEAVYIDLMNDTMYGVFTDGMNSSLCSYTMTKIQERYIDGTCGCAKGQIAEQDCNGEEISYLVDSTCDNRARDRNEIEQYQCKSVAEDGRPLYQYALARIQLEGNVLDTNLPGQHSSLVIFNKEDITVALVITSSTSSDATLNKIHIQSGNSGRLYETIDLATNGDLLKDAYVNNESEELYILTTGEVMKLAVINCSQYTTCGECLGPSNEEGDPFCGWCIFETKCSRASECSDTANRLQYNQDCIDITSLSSTYQDIERPPQSVTFSVSQLPTPHSYTCRFDSIETDTQVSGMNISCLTPAVDDRPVIPNGENSVTMELGVYSITETVVIVTEDYDFFNCSAINSCSECASSEWGCDWCVYTGTCTMDRASRCTRPGEIIVTNGDVHLCPRLNNVTTEILIPVGLRHAIGLTGINLPDPAQVDYKCVLSTDGVLLKTVDVSNANGTYVECEETEYDYDSSDGLEIQVNIRVEYQPDVFIDNKDNTVTLYNCSVNGMSCRSCVTPLIREELGCGWCEGTSICQVNVPDRQCGSNFFARGQSTSCPNAAITKIFPVSGPIEGNTTLTISGTNLAAQFNETLNITVATVECTAINLNPGTSIDCLTGSPHNETLEGLVTVVFSFGSDTSEESFSYRNPSVAGFSPSTGIVSGGTELKITGNDLNTGRVIQAFVGNTECKITENSITSELITCVTGESRRGNYSVTMSFDGAERAVPGGYLYAPDPSIVDYTPKESIMSGGIELTVSGKGFSILQTAALQLTINGETIIEECSKKSNTELKCPTPNLTPNLTAETPSSSRRRRQATLVETAFLLDGFFFPTDEGLSFFPDPVYEPMDVVITSPGETVTLTGENLNVPSENIDEFVIVCMGQGRCEVTEATPTTLNCLSPAEQPQNGICEGNATDLPNAINIVVFHGKNVIQIIGTATYDNSNSLVPIIVGACVGGVVLFSLVLFLAFVSIGHRNYKATIKKTEMEMENLMQNSKREVMTGFFIDQEMTDIEDQLKGLGMPFVSNHDYMKSMLFFGLDTKPDDRDPEIPSESEEMAMIAFSKLLSNKDFLLIFIQTLDKCRKITTKEKANIASLLTVVLVMERKFRYFTEVLTTLMSDTIGEAADRQRLKQLFKRTESLEDKMLNNWIALAMFKFIKESAGEPLYKLYQAIKIQCEKGPVDAITGQSFFSLNFDNLLTESQEFEEVTLNVDSELGVEEVRVLDVDTITQVKEKILDAMYRKKHTKYQRSAREVDLVLKSGQTGQLVICDYDTSSHPSMGWCEVNTIKHYGIPTGSRVSLTDKQAKPNSDAIPMNDAANNLFNDATRQSVRVTGHHDYLSHDLETGPQDIRYYHLVQSDDAEEEEEGEEGFCDKMQRVLCFKGTQGKRKIREIYLQRLVSVKQSINNFVNDALDAMFTIQENGYENNLNNIPFALRFLFNFFDEEASRYDDDESTTWKNNILPLRFWATILAHPSFIFNMRQSRTADASVTVLNQMLDNAAKGVVPKLKMPRHEIHVDLQTYENCPIIIKNSSPSRLLFNRELPSHINLLITYYHNINQSGRLEERDLKVECSRIDEEFSGLFSRLTTLRKLYESIRPHEEILLEALEQDEICSAAHFAKSLERVGNTLYQTED